MNKTINWRIGCSGYHYKEWKEIFYPPGLQQRLWFSHYVKHFNTIELNNTFYQFPKIAALQKWFADSPDDFTFSLKVPRIITHYKKFTGTEQLLADFYGTIKEGLGSKLGTVLFQLPPQIPYSAEMLQKLISSLQPGFNNDIEFRHASWWKQKVYDELGAQGIGFCGSSHPKLPDQVIINTNIVYYRFHGVPNLFKSQYEDSFLEKKAKSIQKSMGVNTACLYFNNTWGTAALANARFLRDYVTTLSK